MTVFAAIQSPAFDAPRLGPWLFLFALGAIAPIMAWALWPRRAAAQPA
jgi:hypothetical protein